MKSSKFTSHVKVSTILSSIDKLKFSDDVESQLSQVPHCRRYIKFIGISRLLSLLDVVNEIHENDFEEILDPVGEILSNIGIEFDFFDVKKPSVECLHEIDLLLMNSKIAKVAKKYKVTMKLDQNLLLEAVKSLMQESEIQIMIAIKRSGGDPNTYLQNVAGQHEPWQTA